MYYQLGLANDPQEDDPKFETSVEAMQAAWEIKNTDEFYVIWEVEEVGQAIDPLYIVWRGELWRIA